MAMANQASSYLSVSIRGPDSVWEMMPEEDVVAAARQGSERASEYLIRKYRGVVRKNIRPYYLKGADREDLLQEGMIGLVNAIKGYSSGKHSSFYSFADLCIHRQVLTAIKRANRHKHNPLNDYRSIDAPLSESNDRRQAGPTDRLAVCTSYDPEAILLGTEMARAFKERLLEMLSPMEQRVLSSYLEGKNYRQIAAEMQRSEKSVDNALTRIRHKAGRLDTWFRDE